MLILGNWKHSITRMYYRLQCFQQNAANSFIRNSLLVHYIHVTSYHMSSCVDFSSSKSDNIDAN